MGPVRARTSSAVWRIRHLLAIKLLKNKELYKLTIRLPDGSETSMEAIPRTVNERELDVVVPGVTKMRLIWESLMAIEPIGDDDEEATTDPIHPFSASDLPFDS